MTPQNFSFYFLVRFFNMMKCFISNPTHVFFIRTYVIRIWGFDGTNILNERFKAGTKLMRKKKYVRRDEFFHMTLLIFVGVALTNSDEEITTEESNLLIHWN